MRVLLLSTYDLGHQPFGLASPAAWLRHAGHEVITVDLSREKLPLSSVRVSDWICFHLPMHTATRMAVPKIEAVRRANPSARLCCYGLYAPMNEALLRSLGVESIIGGEFEQAVVDAVSGKPAAPALTVLDRLPFRTPDRTGLPPLERYAGLLSNGERLLGGYTEASRGCKHLCRHCPIVPVYEGRFRIVPRDIVLADVRQQVSAGARHITFGDPDFLNGPGHALPLIEAFRAEFPNTTYDVTIKIEHLLRHPEALPVLARTGCLFITSAVESLDDGILDRLAKGHTRADFLRGLDLVRGHGLTLLPTFVTFTPWTTHEIFLDLLRTIHSLDLIENVTPIQFAIRLLIPTGSKILELSDLPALEFDAAALQYRWKHPDPEMDRLCSDLLGIVRAADSKGASRTETFSLIWQHTFGEMPATIPSGRTSVPHMSEPWYCCAEPDEESRLV